MKDSSLKTAMIRRARPFGALAHGLLVAGAAAAQTSPTPLAPVNVTASATVQAPMSATLAQNLHFGSFIAEKGGTIDLDAITNLRSASGPSLLTSNAGYRGQINLVGSPGATFSVSLPATVQLVMTGTQETMSLAPSHSVTEANGGAVLNSSGNGTFYIGGRLTVSATQAPGNYQGNSPVTVTYP